jgi:hypothetical protein
LTTKTNNERYKKHLRIGVRVEESGIVLLNGQPLPQLYPKSVGEIVFSPECFVDEKIRLGFTNEKFISYLKRGSSIMMGVSPSVIGSTLQKGLIHPDSIRIHSEYMFVEVRLDADQRLQVRGDEVAKLAPCPCSIPALDRMADSLNHAFTMISEVYETRRRSHTGNVFKQAYAEDNSGKWESLDELRLRAIQRMLLGRSNQQESMFGDFEV